MQGVMAAPATDMPTDAEAAFEELYRSSRDDVFAYVARLLRDRSAAEDVTATAFEQRLPPRFLPLIRPGPRHAPRLAVRDAATPRSTSCAAASGPPR